MARAGDCVSPDRAFFPLRGINLGHAGVNLFFVLSGFLMARILFLDNVPIPTFYKRRSSRIFPAVFGFLVLITGTYLVLGKPVNWTAVAAAAAFVNNYFPSQPGAAPMPFGHLRSLGVEEHSYVLLSIVAAAARAPSPRDDDSRTVFSRVRSGGNRLQAHLQLAVSE